MLEIAIDIGGTFTDIVCLQDQQRLCLAKVPTTPYDLVQEVHVGPQSAGANPGPACYGRGGTVPTVTDASVVLGYLNPYYFARGDLTLQVDQVVRDMAARLHMTPEALAVGMHHILNACMADEIRLVSVRRGYDPRQFALVPLGGAGPVHGGRLAAMLSIPTTVVPTAPGVLSAFGLLVANIEHDQSRTFAVKAAEVDVERIVQVLAELDLLGQEKMQRDHVPPELVHVTHAADLRYVGQSYELEVPLLEVLDASCGAQAVAAFHAAHQQVYGHSRPSHVVEFVNLRSVHSAPLPRPQLTVPAPSGSLEAACKGMRPAYFDEYLVYRDTLIYQRDLLPLGAQFDGPAIVEQPDTTAVVYPGFTCLVDDIGNLLLTLHTR
jgi:N-methylhydantoinase A